MIRQMTVGSGAGGAGKIVTYEMATSSAKMTVPYTGGASSLAMVLVYQDADTAFLKMVNGGRIYAMYNGQVEDLTYTGAYVFTISESGNGLTLQIDDGAGQPIFPSGPVSVALMLK